MKITNKDVRDEIALLARVGWEVIGHTGGGHIELRHADGACVTLPNSPSDPRWRNNTRAFIAGRMGLTMTELVERMTGHAVGTQQPAGERKRRRRVRHRRRSTSPAALTLVPSPPPSPVAVIKPRAPRDIDTVARERQAARTAGDPDLVAELEDELERLYERKRLQNARRA